MNDPLAAYFAATPQQTQQQKPPSSHGHGLMVHARPAADVASAAHTLWQLGKVAMPLIRGAGAFL